jgi:hypothetical protein
MMNSIISKNDQYLTKRIDWNRIGKLVWISDNARSMGIHLMAGKGSGKSRMMGRLIGWLDFVRGFPQVIFDPHGPTIDNLLDKIIRMPPEIQKRLWPRVLYVDMSGKAGRVIPFPLFYRLEDESLYEISQRFLDVVRRIDPFLQTASIEGWNALWRVGTYVGMVLAALDLQITEAESLLRFPEKWRHQLETARGKYPELNPAVEYLLNLPNEKEANRARKVGSFLNKISIFSLEHSMKSMFGASEAGIDWQEIVEKGITVLFDFRHEHDIERRRFKMVWSFNNLLDFVKHRGAGRHKPIGLIIDELTSLFSLHALTSDLFGSEMDELINVLARNYRLWLTIAHQEMFQLTEKINKSLMTMGTQILGVTADPKAARFLSDLYFEYKPDWIRKYEPIYGSVNGIPALIDYTTVEFTPQEQELLQSYFFRRKEPFHFLIRPAPGEGNIQGTLREVSIADFDKGIFPHPTLVPEARKMLMKTNGVEIEKILGEIEMRTKQSRFLQDGKNQMGDLPNGKSELFLWD